MIYRPETFERGPQLEWITSALPAATYNLTRILLAASGTGCVFIPIRSIQYLAVVDQEEIIFVDSQFKRWVDVVWGSFEPQTRNALDEPVPYQATFFTPDGRDTQRRLQTAFYSALALLARRRQPTTPALILPLRVKPAAHDG